MHEDLAKEEIKTIAAPTAIGSYSQGIRVGHMIFLSGQLPLNPTTMELVNDDIKSQVLQVFVNLQSLATAAKATASDFVKLTVYLTNLAHFQVVNEVMHEVLEAPFPARSTVGVAALPKGALVEIDAILWVPHHHH